MIGIALSVIIIGRTVRVGIVITPIGVTVMKGIGIGGGFPVVTAAIVIALKVHNMQVIGK